MKTTLACAMVIGAACVLPACDSKDHDRLFSENKALSEESRRLAAENADLRERLDVHEQGASSSDGALGQANAALKAANDSIAEFRARLEEAGASRAGLQAKYDQALASIAEAGGEIESLRAQLTDLTSRAQKASDEATQEISRLRAQVADLTTKLNEALEALSNPDRLQDLIPKPPR